MGRALRRALAASIALAAPAAHAFLAFDGTAAAPPAAQSLSVAGSLDGRSVYSTDHLGNGVFTFTRDPASGELVPIDAIYDSTPGVDGLDGAYGVAVSPDGRNVYVAASRDDSVAAFSRDTATGVLKWIGVWKDGVAGADGLDGARAVRVSPDGSAVYVAAEDENAVAVFSRSAVTGLLAPLQVLRNGPFDYDYQQAKSIAMSPNGFAVYVGGNPNVVVHQRDFVTGALTKVDVENLAGGKGFNAQGVAVSPDARHLYVADSYNDRTICFAIDQATGALGYANEVAGGGAQDGFEHTREIALSPDGARVYAVRVAEAELVVYQRDPASGALTFEEVRKNGSDRVTGLDGPLGVFATRDGRNVYVADYNDASVASFATPDLVSHRQRIWNGTPGVSGLHGADAIAVTPDGHHVYAASAQGAVARFGRNTADGSIAFLGAEGGPGLSGAAGIAISPDGSQLLVAAPGADTLSLYARDPGTGDLFLQDQATDGGFFNDGLGGATAVSFSPDGRYAYVAAATDEAIGVFEVGGSTLGFLEAAPISGGGRLGGAPRALAMSPDGAHLYVAGMGSAVAIFARSENGPLSFVDTIEANGLDGATAIAVSGDGMNVYAAGDTDDAVVAFERNPGSGLLTPLEVERAGVSGYEPGGAGGPVALALSPDGSQLYAADAGNAAVVRFVREPGGALTFVEMDRDLVSTMGLGGASALATSGDGRNLYVAAATADSVSAFSTVPEPDGALASLLAVASMTAIRGTVPRRSAREPRLRQRARRRAARRVRRDPLLRAAAAATQPAGAQRALSQPASVSTSAGAPNTRPSLPCAE